MNKAQYNKMELLIEQALTLPPEKRLAFIQQECGTDEEVLQEITSLLQFESQAFDFVRNFSENVVRASLADLPGDKIDKDPKINTFVKHYHITEKLGSGGMGVVYKAHDMRLDRIVALKFLPLFGMHSEQDKQRLLREARAAAALSHPNICTVFNVEEHDGEQFIVMEYIEGETLFEKLQTRIPDHKTALRYIIQITEAIAEAHENGIIHRDIKPRNIMVNSKDRIKVMDFGIAKIKTKSTITQFGAKMGTASYLAPELIRGNRVDHRADLFSLGVVMFEILTGRYPFNGQTETAIIYSIVNDQAPLITDIFPLHPQKLSKLVNRLLEKNPENRYLSAAELVKDLKACQGEVQILKPESSTMAISQLADTSESSVSKMPKKNDIKDSSEKGFSSVILNAPALRSGNGKIILVGGVIILLFIAYGLFSVFRSPAKPFDGTLAVLPLESVSQQPEDVQFADGFHEELINRLAGIGDLKIIARSSVLRYSYSEKDLQSIAQELGVSMMIEGTVRRFEDRIRISVQLIDIETLGTIWSESYEENLNDIFEIQGRIAREVAGELQASLLPEELERLNNQPTDNSKAYLLYMRGREFLSRPLSRQDILLPAQQLFNNAVEQDPQFAQAWAMLSYTYSYMYWFHERNPDYLQRMKETAEYAQLLNAYLPETQLALGMYYYWSDTNYKRTLSHFETALQKFPNQPTLHLMTALTHRRLGNWELVIYHLNKALELDPLKIDTHLELGWNYYLLRDFKKDEEILDRLRELKLDVWIPDYWFARLELSENGTLEGFEKWWNELLPADPAKVRPFWWGEYNMMKRNWQEAVRGYSNLNEIFVNGEENYVPRDYFIGLGLDFQGRRTEALGHFDRARKHLEQLRNEHPDESRYRATLGKVYVRLGKFEQAIEEGEKAIELTPINRNAEIGPAFVLALAEIYAWSGHEELAIDNLEICLSVPSYVHRHWLRLNPIWDPLRDNPRFKNLIEERDEPYKKAL